MAPQEVSGHQTLRPAGRNLTPNLRLPGIVRDTLHAAQNYRICPPELISARILTAVQNGGSRAPRTWKVLTQRDEGAGLSALPGLGAGLRAVKAACS